jgi:hypothetical protein
MIKERQEHGYSAILCCCRRNRQITADNATPTSIKTMTTTIFPEASARASYSMISLEPRSTPSATLGVAIQKRKKARQPLGHRAN